MCSSSILYSSSTLLHIIHTSLQAELEGLDGIVLPGGESTTMGLIAERSGILPSLRALIAPGTIPVFATCAG